MINHSSDLKFKIQLAMQTGTSKQGLMIFQNRIDDGKFCVVLTKKISGIVLLSLLTKIGSIVKYFIELFYAILGKKKAF